MSIFAWALEAAFFPLAAGVAWRLLPTLRPARHRPLFFVIGGLLMLVLGAFAACALRPAVASGVIHFSSRRVGEVHAVLANDPVGYWVAVLLLYAAGVFLAGFGFAGIGLCFRKEPGGNPET